VLTYNRLLDERHVSGVVWQKRGRPRELYSDVLSEENVASSAT
jgi:hypothetical protein